MLQDTTDPLTVTIPGAEVQVEEAAATAEPEAVSGEISQAIQDAVPSTGNDAIDEALETLSAAIGNLTEAMIGHLPQMAIALVVLVATAFIASFGQRFAKKVFSRLRQSLRDLFAQFAYIALWMGGLIVATGIIFPGFGFAEVVATAGLLSIAIGFAFQDIFENFFAGILILWRFPFEPGDFIEIESEGITGKVEDIWIRMTLIRLTTGELVTVPNSTVYKSPIRILTNKNTRRVTVECGVAYGEDVGEAREVITKAVKSCDSVNGEKPVQIFLTGFGASSMDFEVTWWTGAKPVEIRESRDQVIESVKRALDDAGIEIPYPYRVLTFTKNEPLIYEKLGARADGGSDD